MFSKKNFPVEKIEDKLEKFLIHYEFKYDKNRADTGSVYFEIYDPDLGVCCKNHRDCIPSETYSILTTQL